MSLLSSNHGWEEYLVTFCFTRILVVGATSQDKWDVHSITLKAVQGQCILDTGKNGRGIVCLWAWWLDNISCASGLPLPCTLQNCQVCLPCQLCVVYLPSSANSSKCVESSLLVNTMFSNIATVEQINIHPELFWFSRLQHFLWGSSESLPIRFHCNWQGRERHCSRHCLLSSWTLPHVHSDCTSLSHNYH